MRPAESPSRLAWRVTEPLHAFIYFLPEPYAKLGVHGMDGYFASRGAAFGAVGPGPVTATFYVFHPGIVARALPDVWSVTTPAAVLAARLEAADAALRNGLGEAVDSPEMTEAAELARRAAESAAAWPHGRPLYAATAELPWPDEPHLRLFHAQGLLREFRGDGHVAALLTAGLSGLEAMILQVAAGAADRRFLQPTRGWSDAEWAAGADGLRTRELLDVDLGLTDAGREQLADVEATTDRLSEPAYRAIGADGQARLAELTRQWSRTVVKAGMLDPRTLIGQFRHAG